MTSEPERTNGETDADDELFARIGTETRSHEIMLQQAACLACLGYFVFNVRDDIVEVCSKRHAAIFGLTPPEFLSRVTGIRSTMDMIHPEDRDPIRAAYARLRAGENIEMEYRFRRDDGSTGVIREFVAPEADATGEVVRGLGSSIDVTATRRAEEGRAQASRLEALGELTAGVAHDFNNLLAIIMGNAELMQVPDSEPDLESCTAEIVEAARRGGTLTRSLLSFSQRATMTPEPADLGGEAARALAAFERTMLRQAKLTRDMAAADLTVRLDRDQLQAVLINLLINARDAIAPGGRIAVTTARVEVAADAPLPAPGLVAGAYGVIAVADDGCGIPAALMERVTEPFFTTKNRAEGSGLGLSMAMGFARQSGGTLAVESREGVGTTVRLYFPLVEARPAEAEAAAVAPVSDRTRVLLVEDDPAVSRMLKAQLGAARFEVTLAQTEDEVLAALARDRFDLAILDNVLPGRLRGIDVAERVKAADAATGTVLLSGLVGPELARPPAHVDAVLSKPVRFPDLLRTLRTVAPDPG